MQPEQKRVGRDTRARILDVSAELFGRRGYSGTSIRDIAEALGVTKAALYYHFKSKDDVLAALVEPVFAALDDFVDEVQASGRTDGRRILCDAVELIAANAPTLAYLITDPEVMRSQAGRFNMYEKHVRLVRLIVGPAADAPAVIRAHAALGAAVSALQATARECSDPSDIEVVREHMQRHLPTVMAAAIGALHCTEGDCSTPTPTPTPALSRGRTATGSGSAARR